MNPIIKINPTPYTLHPKPPTHTPWTPHPTPYTLNGKRITLNAHTVIQPTIYCDTTYYVPRTQNKNLGQFNDRHFLWYIVGCITVHSRLYSSYTHKKKNLGQFNDRHFRLCACDIRGGRLSLFGRPVFFCFFLVAPVRVRYPRRSALAVWTACFCVVFALFCVCGVAVFLCVLCVLLVVKTLVVKTLCVLLCLLCVWCCCVFVCSMCMALFF